MVVIRTTPDAVHVDLSTWEKLGSLHGSLEIAWPQVRSMEYVDDLWQHLRGTRAPGTGIPGVIMLGTTRFRGGRDFNAVYGHRPGVVITLRGYEFARVLATGPAVEMPLAR